MKMTRLLLVLICTTFCAIAYAQDIVVKKNGEKLNVKIFKVDDTNIYFRYEGEDLEYQLSKGSLSEIIYKSGRKETFSESVATIPAGANGTKFTITDTSKEFVIINKDLKADEEFLVFNDTGHDIHLTIHGINHKTGLIEQLDNNVVIPSDRKKHNVAQSVEKGRFDHYEAFKVTVAEGHNDKYTSSIVDDNIALSFWHNENEQEIALRKTTNETITIYVYNSLINMVQVKAIGTDGTVLFESEKTNGFGKQKMVTWSVNGDFDKVLVTTNLPSDCKVKTQVFRHQCIISLKK